MTLSDSARKTKAVLLLAVLIVSYLFLFYRLGSYSLKEPDEGRYAEIPREMVEQGDYLVPHLNYVRYFEKPPLLYWMTAGSYKLFGVSEWSFRFPNALVALLAVAATWLFASRWFTRRVALLSSLILLTSFGFFALARVVTTDMLFAFLLFVALGCFYEFYREKRRRYILLFYAVLALATLAKGPVALVLLFATIVLYLFTERRLSFLKEMASVGGLALFAAIAAPWFVLMCVNEKEFFQFFFVDQHFMRFFTTKHKRSGPMYYFIPVLFGGLFPWSVFLPRAVVRFWRARDMRLLLIWSLVVFGFFSVSGSKLPPYILPIYPALSIVLGRLFDEGWKGGEERKGEVIVYLLFFAGLAVAGLAYGSGLLDGFLGTVLPDIASLSTSIRGLSLGMGAVSMAIIVLLIFGRMGTLRSLFFILGAFSLAVVVTLMLHAQVIDGFSSTKRLADAIIDVGHDDPVIIDFGSFEETLPFYTRKRTYIAEYKGELAMGSKYPDAKGFFLSQEDIVRLFQSDRPVFVVSKAKRLPLLERLGIKNAGDLVCQDGRCLITNGWRKHE